MYPRYQNSGNYYPQPNYVRSSNYNPNYRPNYNNAPKKKRSGSKMLVNKDTGEFFGISGWCIRNKQMHFVKVIKHKSQKYKNPKSGHHSAFAEITNKVTGQSYLVNADINMTKNIATIQDMTLVLNPSKNYCGTYLKR